MALGGRGDAILLIVEELEACVCRAQSVQLKRCAVKCVWEVVESDEIQFDEINRLLEELA